MLAKIVVVASCVIFISGCSDGNSSKTSQTTDLSAKSSSNSQRKPQKYEGANESFKSSDLVGCWYGGNGVNMQEKIFLGDNGEFYKDRLITGGGSPMALQGFGKWKFYQGFVVLTSTSGSSLQLKISNAGPEIMFFDEYSSYRRCR